MGFDFWLCNIVIGAHNHKAGECLLQAIGGRIFVFVLERFGFLFWDGTDCRALACAKKVLAASVSAARL